MHKGKKLFSLVTLCLYSTFGSDNQSFENLLAYLLTHSFAHAQWTPAGAYEQEHATPLYFCHGVFIDRFIF